MTTIAVKKVGGVYEIAADRQATHGHSSRSSFEKVFDNNGITFGVAGRVRTSNLLRYSFKPPKRLSADKDTRSWIINKVIPAMQKCFTEAKAMTEDSGWNDNECDIIILVDGIVGYIGCDFSLTGTDEVMWSIGSGSDFAMGAMSAGSDAAGAVVIAGTLDVYTGSIPQTWEVSF